ncbi:transposase [Pyxidicoccus sp. MSG2]|uniref:transposase n=1 Tax=Pyxidicoccus sp. MSG2 TaxID=2996790 RepID=UPI002271DE4C|nr:transposase [Pyxidicoccus sp. MSG2]MCY1017705.1 transposase [Pyxidicoccus sp. MSG2]
MRGTLKQQTTMFSLRTPGARIAKDHPLRRVKDMADAALAAPSPTFDRMYSRMGRPSIPPEQLLKTSQLLAFYSVRSERLSCEQLDFNLLFRWFLDMGIEEASLDHSSLQRRGRGRRRHQRQRQQGWARAGGVSAHRGSTRRVCCTAFSRWTSSAAPGAGADSRVLAYLRHGAAIHRILQHLTLPDTPAPLAPARWPPRQALWG